MIGFLTDQHVLIELIQLGRNEKNEVLAWCETNAKAFLYPNNDNDSFHVSGQQDVFMKRSEEFPGGISPQLIFSTSTRIDETQTPSLDILREYENRFVHDPLIEMNKKASNKKVKINKSLRRGVLRNNQENFANHTISSAIKADYTLLNVKNKLNELNQSVKNTRIIKTAPSLIIARKNFSRPFVVRKVEEQLILRKPELHDVLHDGLVLIKKNRNRSGRKQNKNRTKSKSKFPVRSRSNDFRLINLENKIRSRSFSPPNRSLNTNLRIENSRSPAPSRSLSDSSSRRHNGTYDIIPESEALTDNFMVPSDHTGKFDTNYENFNNCLNTYPSNCEVCQDFRYRTNQNFKGHRFHRNVTEMKKNANSSAIFNTNNNKDSENLAILDQYGSTHYFKDENEYSHHVSNKIKDKKKHYPTNKSFSQYSPSSSKNDWRYSRYYPWLFNYTEYLRELEDELHWLKVRSKYLNKN